MTFSVSQFHISDDNLLRFRRFVKKPMDCVINALEILHVLDQNSADLMRIVVGDTGLTIDNIQQIFKYMYPQFRFRFFKYTNLQTLGDFCKNELNPGHVLFCGYIMKGFGHVFLIGKNLSGEVLYIDPQVDAYCDLSTNQCAEFIMGAEEYFILQSTTSGQVLQQQGQRMQRMQKMQRMQQQQQL